PLASRWPGFLTISIVVALVSVLGGLLISVALDVAPGAAIILLGAALFVGALAVARVRRS
ncbi:MAG: metal ABC transporter permease, partial [Thermoanaerobaculia bacterium]|nr:metal ABC transporter permease [Thermoanaerobaculia bacterium]